MKGWTTTQHAMAASRAPAELVARAIGKTQGAISTYRWRNKLTTPQRKFSAEDDAHLLKAREVGFTWHEIAQQMGRTAGSCQSRFAKLMKCRNK